MACSCFNFSKVSSCILRKNVLVAVETIWFVSSKIFEFRKYYFFIAKIFNRLSFVLSKKPVVFLSCTFEVQLELLFLYFFSHSSQLIFVLGPLVFDRNTICFLTHNTYFYILFSSYFLYRLKIQRS